MNVFFTVGYLIDSNKIGNCPIQIALFHSLACFPFQEQSLYEREGLNMKKINYIDNQDCIGMSAIIIIIIYFENVYFFHAVQRFGVCPYEVPTYILEYCSFRLQTKQYLCGFISKECTSSINQSISFSCHHSNILSQVFPLLPLYFTLYFANIDELFDKNPDWIR